MACGRTSHQLLFSSPDLGGGGVASGWPENGPAAQPAGYQPPGHFPQQLQLLPVSPRPPPASRASREGEEGGQGRGCEESSSRLWGVAAEAGYRCGDPSCSPRWDFQSSYRHRDRTCRAVLDLGHFSFLHVFSPSSAVTLRPLAGLSLCITEFALRLSTEGPQVSDVVHRKIRLLNSIQPFFLPLLFLLPMS